jgi:hypothetical protein
MRWKVSVTAVIVVLGLYSLGVPVVSSQGLFVRSQYLADELPFEPKSPLW